MTVLHSVRPCPADARPAPEAQLAWALAELAADLRPVDPEAADMTAARLVDNMACAVAALDRPPVAAARAQALCFPRSGGARLVGLHIAYNAVSQQVTISPPSIQPVVDVGPNDEPSDSRQQSSIDD